MLRGISPGSDIYCQMFIVSNLPCKFLNASLTYVAVVFGLRAVPVLDRMQEGYPDLLLRPFVCPLSTKYPDPGQKGFLSFFLRHEYAEYNVNLGFGALIKLYASFLLKISKREKRMRVNCQYLEQTLKKDATPSYQIKFKMEDIILLINSWEMNYCKLNA